MLQTFVADRARAYYADIATAEVEYQRMKDEARQYLTSAREQGEAIRRLGARLEREGVTVFRGAG